MSVVKVVPDVIMVSQVPPPVHGSTLMTRLLKEILSDSGSHVELVDRRFSSTIGDVGRFKPKKVVSGLGLIMRLAIRLSRSRRSVVILFATTRPMSFVVDWLLSELLRISRRPPILYLHTQGFSELAGRSRMLRFMVRRTLTYATAVVCLSESLYGDISPWVARERVLFFPNALPEEPPLKAPSATEQDGPDIRVLYLSNWMPKKGVSAFLEAALAVAPNHPNVIFDVVGTPVSQAQFDSFRARVSEAKLDERIIIHGAKHGSQKWDLLSSASLLVFCSELAEAQPLTIIEAFACGTPVLAYSSGGVVDLVVDGSNGILVPPGNLPALRESLAQLLDDDMHWLARAGARATQTFNDRYTREAYKRSWLDLLSSLGSMARLDTYEEWADPGSENRG